MKIKSVHIYNIASIVDETIDFTQSPLVDSDVFLITGNMGSGKTTILDSICLALYNTTPRLDRCSNVKVENNSDNLTLDDPRNLMRRNTGEAFVELLFEGIDGVDYIAEWHVQRGKKKKVTVGIDNVDWSLKNLSTDVTVTGSGKKTTDVEAAIAQAVGLDFDQFCRTTMLAQGEFTRFLKSNEDEKANILEKLTKFTDYASIGRTVFAITQEKKADWEEACRNASDTGLSVTQLEEKNARMKELDESLKEQRLLLSNAEEKRNWLKKEADLNKTLASENEQCRNARAVLDSDEYKNGVRLVSDWNASIDARTWQKKTSAAKHDESVQSNALKALESEFFSVLAGQQYNEHELAELEKGLAELNSYMESQKDKVNLFENSQAVLGYLNAIIEARKVIERNSLAIKKKSAEFTSLEETQAKCEKLFSNESGKQKEIEGQIESKDAELKGLGMQELRDNRERVRDLLADIILANDAVSAISQAKENVQKETERLSGVKAELDGMNRELAESVIPAYQNASVEKRAAEASMELLTNTVDKFAKQMRQKLQVGCNCPVCRQEVVKLPLEAEIDELYSEAEKRFIEAKASFLAAEEKKNRLEAEIKVKKENYNKDAEALKNSKEISDAESKALVACQKCGTTQVSVEALNALKAQADASLANLEKKIGTGSAIEKNLSVLRAAQTAQNMVVEDCRTALESARRKVLECGNEMAQLRNINDLKQADIDAACQNASAIMTDPVWTVRVLEDTIHLKEEFAMESALYRTNSKLLSEISSQRQKLGQIVSAVRKAIDDILANNPSWKEITADAAAFDGDLLAAANAVIGKYNTADSLLQKARTDIRYNTALLQSFVESHEGMTTDRLMELDGYKLSDMDALNTRLEQMRSNLSTHEGLLNRAMADSQEHAGIKPEFAATETIDELGSICLKLQSAISGIDQQVGGIKVELEADSVKKKALGALQDKEKETAAEYSKWKNLNSLIGDKDGRVFKRIAQSYILGGLLDSANTYLQKLEPRYTLIAVPGTLHLSLEDAYQGFATRGTDSLSGGEGFLVSLALALALADVGQALSVDTLFIDEGFGTLSGQPLVNAINTLRNLRGQNGRHVGIISHIQEVRDNIPVQIQVIQSGKSSSSTIEIVG